MLGQLLNVMETLLQLGLVEATANLTLGGCLVPHAPSCTPPPSPPPSPTVSTIGKEPVKVDAIRKESCLAIGPYLSATKDEEWLETKLVTLEELEAEYAPHPFPYEGAD